MYWLFLLVSTAVFSTTIVLLKSMLPFGRLSQLARRWALINLSALRLICRLDFRMIGHEHLPSRNAIVLCKHQSAWETIALRAILPVEQTWVLKAELVRVPIFGNALKAFAPITIDRSAGLRAIKKLVSEGKTWLDAGRWVLIFPEGTRVTTGHRGNYNIGGALLAQRTGYPIVPIAHNAGMFWSRRGFQKRPGTIDLVIGPLIDVCGKSAHEINLEAQEWIELTVGRLEDIQSRMADIEHKL